MCVCRKLTRNLNLIFAPHKLTELIAINAGRAIVGCVIRGLLLSRHGRHQFPTRALCGCDPELRLGSRCGILAFRHRKLEFERPVGLSARGRQMHGSKQSGVRRQKSELIF